MEFLAPLLFVGGAAAVEWKTGILRRGISRAVAGAQTGTAWVSDERGAYASLAEQLQYRDFYSDGICETVGKFWCGFEARVPSTEGLSNADQNELARKLNRCFAGLPKGAHVQTINRFTHTPTEPFEVLERLAAQAGDPTWAAYYRARGDFLRLEQAERRLRERRTWIFIGLPLTKSLRQRISLGGLLNPQRFIDLEWSEYKRMREAVFSLRDRFQSYFIDAGGSVTRSTLNHDEMMRLAHWRLNPERACHFDVPAYEWEWNTIPRELLCMTSVDVERDILRFNDAYAATLVLHRQPLKANPTTLDRVLRSAYLNFDFEFTTHFEIGDWVKWDNKLSNC